MRNISTDLVNAPSELEGAQILLFDGQEGLSQLFCYKIEIILPQKDENRNISVMVGKTLAIKVMGDDNVTRYYHGCISKITELLPEWGYYRYSFLLQPKLWFLSQNRLNRIYQEKNLPDIIKSVLGDKISFNILLKGDNYKLLECCVQYQESDFSFISRLMEEQGVYYFFQHSESDHQLIIVDADTRDVHKLIPGCESMEWLPGGGKTQATMQKWQPSAQWKLDCAIAIDFNFTQAMSRESGILQARSGEGTNVWIDYPAGARSRAELQDCSSLRWGSWNAVTRHYQGETEMPVVAAGGIVGLQNVLTNADINSYLIIELHIRIEAEFSAAGACNPLFSSKLSLQKKEEYFFPPRMTPKPKIIGHQTAFVVGENEEKLCVDEFGRIKVLFHWSQDEECSCWVRVSQQLAGNRWGGVFLPRNGQEVVVTFMDGDPGRPLVTGCVYNAGMKPPYSLTDPQNSGGDDQRSRNGFKFISLGNDQIFNELRFDSKNGSEQFLLHAGRNKDVSVANDAFEWVGNERHFWVKKSLYSRIEGDEHRQVDGNVRQQVNKDVSLIFNGKSAWKIKEGLTLSAGKLDIKSESGLILEAGSTLTLKAGSSTLVLGPDGIFIDGVQINIKAVGRVNINSGGSTEVMETEQPETFSPKGPSMADDGSN